MAGEMNVPGSWDPKKLYNISPEEKALIESRAATRAALKAEFQMKVTNPHQSGPGFVFDPALQRYLSMRSRHYSHFKKTPKNFGLFIGCVIAPIIALTFGTQWDRDRFDRKCRQGEVAYADRDWKFI
ncbi:hypothetical protein CAPTEDRAFT_157564 [Capitella teleta]|uniref:NADH dehydrogenase [ubiquinone] 1 beta subcomplex subunit 4 n=1 Tax=Capitella teleta TaxID=283909 RepID=R7TQG4_CAPTE|nr:hypothetical protein CAPTEDRAFT_157564 [Capitella teleta]|eukprot:ELT95889.1 hypothetical protein CAPTEDRAFT_157564 [Capitella teleta]